MMGGVVCEVLTEEKVISILKGNGIREGCGDWNCYEQAKKIIFQGKFHPNYDTIIPWLIKYVGV